MLRIAPPDIFFLKNSVPNWVLAGSSLYWNFAAGLYYGPQPSSLSLSRASSALAQDTAGVWYSFASGIPRITNQGFLIEEARTNKSTNFNANPTDLTNVTKSGDAAAVLSVVDDTAALLAAGLQNIATSGKVYKIDNSLGVALAQANVGGVAGNTNAHSLSSYIRGGTGKLTMTTGGGTTFGASATYVYLKSANVTPAAGSTLAIAANAGQIVFFILNQFEEGAFVTSPIVIAGASATRAADVPQLTGQAATLALSAKAAFFQTSGLPNATPTGRLIESSTGGTVQITSTTTLTIVQGANSAVATIGGGGNITAVVKSAFAFDASSMTVLANNGTKATNANSFAFAGSSLSFGNNAAGTRALNGYMQRFALSLTKGAFDGATTP